MRVNETLKLAPLDEPRRGRTDLHRVANLGRPPRKAGTLEKGPLVVGHTSLGERAASQVGRAGGHREDGPELGPRREP